MSLISRVATAIALKTLRAADWNADLNQILALVNGGLDNINIRPGAGIRQDQGKIALDYADIRKHMFSDLLNWLNGDVLIDGSVRMDKLETGEDKLIPVGIFNPVTPTSYPITVPANQFKHGIYMLWGCRMHIGAHGSNQSAEITPFAYVDGSEITTGPVGSTDMKVTTERDSAGRATDMIGFQCCYIKMGTADNFTSNPPTLNKATSHTFDISSRDPLPAGTVIDKKNIVLLGR